MVFKTIFKEILRKLSESTGEDDMDEFKALSEKIRPMVYELGFLKK